jgi:hypothetical protein
MEGNIRDLKFIQELKAKEKLVHKFKVVGSVTDFKLKQLSKA